MIISIHQIELLPSFGERCSYKAYIIGANKILKLKCGKVVTGNKI